jgi:peptidoglycan/LPS O-acetylase OafA/YrhL
MGITSTPVFPRRNNNLEWLRLIFAIQVVFVHAAEHLNFRIPSIVGHFPGVPAFFFVSGFLIYASYLNAPGRRYLENRFLRLYPGLVFVTLGGMLVALAAHGWRDLINHLPTYIFWLGAQTTLGQAYNPGLFRDIGVGAINGSLWTLTTEILFYCSVPIIVRMERRFRFTVPTLIVLSFAVYVLGPLFWREPIYRNKTINDIVALTPIAWGWMFGFGILAVKRFDIVQQRLKYLPFAVAPMAVMAWLGKGPLFASVGNRLGLFYFISYIALVLWFAFATPFVRLKFDLSYGVYVWHMPVINLLLVLAVPSASVAFVLTLAISALSWILVEKPALKLKRQSQKPVDVSQGRLSQRLVGENAS